MNSFGLRRTLLDIGLAVLVASLVAVVCTAFVRSLLWATATRQAHTQLIFALPPMGFVMGHALSRWGGVLQGGTRAVFNAAEGLGPPVSLRLGPAIFVATVATHLVGGSAGREGAAVLLGAAVAEALARLFVADRAQRRRFLLAGMAAGFAAVFGTPVAGALFALECTRSHRLSTDALLIAALAATVAAALGEALGVPRPHYPSEEMLPLGAISLGKWLAFAVCVALVAQLFVWATEQVRHHSRAWIPRLPWRMAAGGALLVVLYLLVGTDRYLGLGDGTIDWALQGNEVPPYGFLLKLVFTAVTLGVGFVGGEVTPLFFMGATLGNVLGKWLDLSPAMASAVGLSTLFAAAAKTPVALAAMAVEILGRAVWPYVLLVAGVACALRRHQPGIYD